MDESNEEFSPDGIDAALAGLAEMPLADRPVGFGRIHEALSSVLASSADAAGQRTV